MNKHLLRNLMILIAFTVGLIFFFIHLSDIGNIVTKILAVLSPIMYGLVIAYVLNYPYKVLHNHAFKNMGKKRAWLKNIKKPLALVLAYVIVLGLLSVMVSVLLPELSSSISMLIDNLPNYARTLQKFSDDTVASVKASTGFDLYAVTTYNEIISYITGDDVMKFITDFAKGVLPSAWTTVVDIGTALYHWILGLVISIYLLAAKDTLLSQTRKLIIAYTPDKFCRSFFKVCNVLNNKCGKFIIGKIIDSSIIGIMCFIGLSIFRFHYSLLISFVVAVFNMIPFFGPIIGAVPCTLLLLIIDPREALFFVLFIIVLQWLDGNVLGPKILGETVGISGFWIMVSVIVGGGLFHIPGMLLGVPVFAAIYVLVSEGVNDRLKKKKTKAKLSAKAAQPVTAAAQPVSENTKSSDQEAL